MKVKTDWVNNGIDTQSLCLGLLSFNVTPCLLPEMTDKLLL